MSRGDLICWPTYIPAVLLRREVAFFRSPERRSISSSGGSALGLVRQRSSIASAIDSTKACEDVRGKGLMTDDPALSRRKSVTNYGRFFPEPEGTGFLTLGGNKPLANGLIRRCGTPVGSHPNSWPGPARNGMKCGPCGVLVPSPRSTRRGPLGQITTKGGRAYVSELERPGPSHRGVNPLLISAGTARETSAATSGLRAWPGLL